uniref:E3 ubiquitin-protein ligase UHRF n=1 Tax=Cyprinus carpio TaxID=7962 RepID=A0A8C2IFH7_CYPCA
MRRTANPPRIPHARTHPRTLQLCVCVEWILVGCYGNTHTHTHTHTVMEDGQTLFDYNVGLNDIVQLLIRSQTDGVASVVSPATVANSNGNGSKPCSPAPESQPSTSSQTFLVDPGIGLFRVNELVDCRDVSIGAWFEGVIEKVTPASKAQNGRVGRPCKRTNGKLDSDYPENGVVEMSADNVRPRARTLLRFDQLQVGDQVMVNYNLENPEERGFWYDAEISTLNAVSRTNKEIRVKILLGGPGDVIGDCKLQFLDEIYRIETPGAPALSLLCDECNMAFHIYCLTPPLTAIPEDEDWYCPTCKNDSSEVVKAGEKLRTSKKKSKMPSATTESQRDWGKGMACVGRTKECTIVPSNHYGPVPGVPVGTTWKFRVQVRKSASERDRSEIQLFENLESEGSVACCCQVVKYWPEIGKCGFLVWRYLLRRDDLEPAPWTPEGIERSKKLGLRVQVRSVCVSEREKRECECVCVCERKRESMCVCEPQEEPQVKRLKEVESFVLSEQQRNLIQEDEPNRKLWDEALSFLSEGPNFLRKVEQLFMCVCCQELSFQPVTTECSHNVCKTCLQRSFRAEVFSCPACRHDLGKDYTMSLNKTLQLLLDQFFPGYSKGR